jgi:hypothetical protein
MSEKGLAHLGLAHFGLAHFGPRPAFSNKPIAAALAAIWIVGRAWGAPVSSEALQSCAQLTDDKQRLACFDRAVAALGTSPGAPAAATAQRETPAPLTDEQKMGLPAERILKLQAPADAAPPKLKELAATIQSVRANSAGREVFTLDNGQVWQQSELDPKFSVAPGDTVKITHGALGSFWMSANAHSNTRVSRLR